MDQISQETPPALSRKTLAFSLPFSLVVALLLLLTVVVSVAGTSKKMTQYSLNDLTASTQRLADQVHSNMEQDRVILTAIADLIALQPEQWDLDTMLKILSTFDADASFVSYVMLLSPDGHLLDQDGRELDAADQFDFSAEADKGAYVSGRVNDLFDPDVLTVRTAVPVVRNGETTAMLYGVIYLGDLAKEYTPDIYGGDAYVCIIDGETGDQLLDTFHKNHKLGNLSDLTGRTMKLGSYEQAMEDMKNNVAGDLSLVSRSTGKTLLMHYEPAGINAWSVSVIATTDTALREQKDLSRGLYRMTAIVCVILVVYMVVVIAYLISSTRFVYRVSITDHNTGLQNRSAYERRVKQIQTNPNPALTCVYLDANGLHEINNRLGHAAGDQLLQAVADTLRAAFPAPNIYRIGGDEFVVLLETDDAAHAQETIQTVAAQLEAQSYSISYGVAYSTGQDEKTPQQVIREADETMLEHKRQYYATHERRRPRS